MVDDFRPGQPQQPNESTEPTDKPDDFQATYENKPETYVTPTGEPTTLEETPRDASTVAAKKKPGVAKWLLVAIVVLLLAGLGALAYWQWTEADNAKKELSSVQSQLTSANAKITSLSKEKADTSKDKTTTVTQTTAEKAKAMATAITTATVATNDTATVDKVSGSFVSISVAVPNSEPILWIFKDTTNGLVKIATYSAVGDGMPKSEADGLKTTYGFDAAAFGLTVAKT